MIYNLAQFVRNQFGGVVVYVNGRVVGPGQTKVPDRCLLLTETGGPEQPWTKYQQLTAQVVARDVDAPKARKLAVDVFTYLTGRFGQVLPQITVGGVNYPAVKTAQISAVQVPYPLGPDEEGRYEYVTNFEVVRVR